MCRVLIWTKGRCSAVRRLNALVGGGFPHYTLDLLFAVGAQIFSEAAPMESCEAAPQVASHPVFCWLNFSSANNTGLHFLPFFHFGFSIAKASCYCVDRAIALLAVRMAYANLRSGGPCTFLSMPNGRWRGFWKNRKDALSTSPQAGFCWIPEPVGFVGNAFLWIAPRDR
jgi:hypothetical protein